MMRVAFAIVLTLCAPLAAAQCASADLNGMGTRAVTDSNAAGLAVGHWCAGKYDHKAQISAASWSALTPALVAELDGLRTAADPVAAVRSLRTARTTMPLSDLRTVWAPLVPKLQATKPAMPAWVVAKNGSRSTRPTRNFLWSDDDVPYFAGDSATLAAVGSPCRCNEAAIESGTTSWCRLPDRYVMAVCARQ